MTLDRKLKITLLVVALIGLIDSLYLTWIKLSHNEAVCLPGVGNCETVNSSRYATFYGIPIALLGVGAYATILLVVYLEQRGGFWAEYGRMIVFGLGLIGVLYSAFLTYIEFFVLHAICPFCVISAIAVLSIFILNLLRLIFSTTGAK